jgi:hypothetical protein
MLEVYIIHDYTDFCLWDQIHSRIDVFPTIPDKFERTGKTVGNWKMFDCIHQWATDGAYLNAGIPHPTYEQLAAVVVKPDNGDMVCRYNIRDVQSAIDFMMPFVQEVSK